MRLVPAACYSGGVAQRGGALATPLFCRRRGEEVSRRRLAVFLTSMILAMLLTGGVAWAAIQCHAGTACQGNEGNNVMFGSQGSDTMYGLGGNDSMSGEAGGDTMYGGDGSGRGMFGGGGGDLM